MKETFTAPSLDEVKALAEKKFGVSSDKINFKVIEETKKSLFKKAKVVAEAEYIAPAPTPAPVPTPVQEDIPVETPAPAETLMQEIAPEPEPAPQSPAPEPEADTKPAEIAPDENIPEEKKIDKAEEFYNKYQAFDKAAQSIFAKENNAAANNDSSAKSAAEAKTAAAVSYITSILNDMGLENVSVEPKECEGGVLIEINADGLSEVIGKKGELLDSLQYLSSLVCNKIDREYFRITTDSSGFRDKRKAQLERLARKIANGVKKNGRTHSLEPMNPYERRIIHAAVSEIDGVTSKSVGEEPYRKVVISSTERRQGGNYRKGGKRGNNNNNRRSNSNSKPKPHYDITTSFEKNYKKPKPEDDMDLGSGVYGKIEF